MVYIIKQFFIFIKELYEKRRLIWELSKRDLKTRFAGSYLGVVWIFVQPVITIIIFWFLFEKGFKSMPVDNFPFLLWLSSGIIPWLFFSEAFMSATDSISGNSYLVKKVAFRLSILPIVKIVSAIIIHGFFLVLLLSMFALYGFFPDLYYLQIIYYVLATIVLLLGLSWITSSAVLFFKDIGPLLNTIIQFLFWGTPIFWSLKILPKEYQFYFKLNPLYYITNGYRQALIEKVWFWQQYEMAICFWAITGTIFIIGAVFFRKLRPHFGDVV